MSHDFATQKAETAAVLGDLQAKHGLPDTADIDFFFVPAKPGADWQVLAEELTKTGFICEWFVAEEAEDLPYLRATLLDQAVSVTGIWIGEETATRAALERGFAPDGWGMQG